jgi:hypothetical protein
MAIASLGLGAALLAGCGSSALSEDDIKDALGKTPSTYHHRAEQYSGDGAVVGGTATDAFAAGACLLLASSVFGRLKVTV